MKGKYGEKAANRRAEIESAANIGDYQARVAIPKPGELL